MSVRTRRASTAVEPSKKEGKNLRQRISAHIISSSFVSQNSENTNKLDSESIATLVTRQNNETEESPAQKTRRGSKTGRKLSSPKLPSLETESEKPKVESERIPNVPEAPSSSEEPQDTTTDPTTAKETTGDDTVTTNDTETAKESTEGNEDVTKTSDEKETKTDSTSGSRRHSTPTPSRKDTMPLRRVATSLSFKKISEKGEKSEKSGKTRKKAKQKEKQQVETVKKEEEPEENPQDVFRQFVFETIRSTLPLVTVNEEVNINVDNVFPVLKMLQLDPNDEVIMDMVRTSCIETYGDINEHEFDSAVLDQRRRIMGEEFEEDIRSAFSVLDEDEDGFITTSDIYKLMMSVGDMLDDWELKEILKAVDYDEDGQINYRDFKYYLIGELDELPVEEEKKVEDTEINLEPEPVEEKKEEEKKEDDTTEKEKKEESEGKEGVEEGTEEGKEEKGEGKEDESKDDNKEEEKPKEEPPKPKPTLNRKSVLWGYMKATTNVIATAREMKEKIETNEEAVAKDKVQEANKNDEEKDKKTPEEEKDKPKETEDNDTKTRPSHLDSGLGSEIESESDAADTSTDISGVISVTVKHLHSITEDPKEDEDVFESEPPKPKEDPRPSRPRRASRFRPLSQAPAESVQPIALSENPVKESETSESRPQSTRPSSERSASERPTSGRQTSQRTSPERPSTARPSSSKSRPVSGSQRLHSALSRVSSLRLSTHSEKDFISTDTESVDLDIQDDDAEGDEDDIFHEPLSDRQIKHVDNFSETIAYSEIPGRQEIIYTDPNYCNYKDPKDHFQRFPRRESGSHVLERCKSASRIQTIRKLESAIFRRQNTEPKLDLKKIQDLNERSKHEPVPTNVNGMTCKHINIDLDFQFDGPTAKYESYSRELLRRPKTAPIFSDRFRQFEKENIENDNHDPEEQFISIIDLTRTLHQSSTGYPENPDMPLKHCGYKSVWPLARVKSARNQRINQGKNIEFNSISRRLERMPVAWPSIDSDSPKYNVLKGLMPNIPPQTPRNQAVITLEIPNLNERKKKLKRISPLSGLLSKAKLRS